MKCLLVDDVEYIRSLAFASASCYWMLKKEVERFRQDNDEEVIKAIWYGTFFKNEINNSKTPSLQLKWINERLGYGVFSAQKINEGSFIGEYVGQVKKYLPLRMKRNDYLGELRLSLRHPLKFIIDAEAMGNLMRFVNHSEDPNLEPITVILNGLLHVIFVAKRKIEPHEQLSFNYGPTYWKSRPTPIKI